MSGEEPVGAWVFAHVRCGAVGGSGGRENLRLYARGGGTGGGSWRICLGKAEAASLVTKDREGRGQDQTLEIQVGDGRETFRVAEAVGQRGNRRRMK